VEDERGLLDSRLHILPHAIGNGLLLDVRCELLARVVAVALRVSLVAALEAGDVRELLAGVLGVVGVVLLVLAAVLAEEANAGHRWLVCLGKYLSYIT